MRRCYAPVRFADGVHSGWRALIDWRKTIPLEGSARPPDTMQENTSSGPKLVDAYLKSALESIDEAERLVVDAVGVAGIRGDELQNLGMAVRESVVNAVVHGNRYNARKRVHLEVVDATDRVTVTVTDEGEGFDLTALPDPVAEHNLLQQSGRGIFLIRKFSDEFLIRRREPNGTEVKLVKYKSR
jgi:serine/threonine-protein kinase RsbW